MNRIDLRRVTFVGISTGMIMSTLMTPVLRASAIYVRAMRSFVISSLTNATPAK